MTQYEELPLFPLTSHVLPNGRLKLRIFEPRYSRLVKQCMAERQDFVVCMFDPYQSQESEDYILPIATAVNIIDFEMLDDGLLGITVEGKERVEISAQRREKDGLRFGQIQRLPHWPKEAVSDDKIVLKQRLQEIFQVYPEVGELYAEPEFEAMDWICHRWLEVLPLDVQTKQQLMRENQCHKVSEYLLQLVT